MTIAKLRTQRAAVDVIDACLQIHGLDAAAGAGARAARCASGPDRRRHRRDHEGDSRAGRSACERALATLAKMDSTEGSS